MKLVKRIFLSVFILVVVCILYVRYAVHESRPEGHESPEADKLAQQMLRAINYDAWDSLSIIRWTFRTNHHYIWDKKANHALISWSDFEVHLNMDEIQGRAFKNGVELDNSDKEKAINTAWNYWCNDSFWLYAPAKIFDPGTKRFTAKDKDGKNGLLISYESGGVTPGDQYLWFLDKTGRPTGFKMWAKILPIGGVYASWDGWIDIPGGSKVSSTHEFNILGVELKLNDISGGMEWVDLGFKQSPIRL